MTKQATAAESKKDAREEKFFGLCAEIIACMGDDWVRVKTERDSSFPIFFARHEPTGFQIYFITGTYVTGDRGSVQISWPKDSENKYWNLRDVARHDAKAPEANFALDRNANSIARQVLRRIFTDEMREAYAQIQQRIAERSDSRTQAEAWIQAVAGALGTTAAYGVSVWRPKDQMFLAHTPKHMSLDYSGAYPGGSATVRLPKDPEKAAALVAAIHAACEEHKGAE